jgi:hypothetical protein
MKVSKGDTVMVPFDGGSRYQQGTVQEVGHYINLDVNGETVYRDAGELKPVKKSSTEKPKASKDEAPNKEQAKNAGKNSTAKK